MQKGGHYMSKTEKFKEKLAITLKPQILEMLDEYANDKGISKSAVVALAVEKYIREEKNREK